MGITRFSAAPLSFRPRRPRNSPTRLQTQTPSQAPASGKGSAWALGALGVMSLVAGCTSVPSSGDFIAQTQVAQPLSDTPHDDVAVVIDGFDIDHGYQIRDLFQLYSELPSDGIGTYNLGGATEAGEVAFSNTSQPAHQRARVFTELLTVNLLNRTTAVLETLSVRSPEARTVVQAQGVSAAIPHQVLLDQSYDEAGRLNSFGRDLGQHYGLPQGFSRDQFSVALARDTLATFRDSPVIQTALTRYLAASEATAARGVTHYVAAGNEAMARYQFGNQDFDPGVDFTRNLLANSHNVTVGSSDEEGPTERRASFSSNSDEVDVLTDGTYIKIPGYLGHLNGTSLSMAIVAGDTHRATQGRDMDAGEIRQALSQVARPVEGSSVGTVDPGALDTWLMTH